MCVSLESPIKGTTSPGRSISCNKCTITSLVLCLTHKPLVLSMMATGAAIGGHPKSKMGGEKLIIRSEKVRLVDILAMLLLRRPITSYAFVDAGDQTMLDVGDAPCGPLVPLIQAILKFFAAAYWPAKVFGVALEFLLNFVALNGGLLGLLWNFFTFKLVIPLDRGAPDFRTVIGMIDGRTELKPAPPATSDGGDMRQLQVLDVVVSGEATDLESGGCAATPLFVQRYLLSEVTVMASKLAYENKAYIKNVVDNVWKFNFVGFYNGWNKFLKEDTTQAFVMTDMAKDASAVLVAFRGTEPLNMKDWSTDVELSWMGMGDMGNVHVGFLKALGLQEEDEKNPARAFPKEAAAAPKGKFFAYYQLRQVVREQLKKHPNARLYVTGHSLGGALAALFPALLALHRETEILGRLRAVTTYGQPRVGDAKFVDFFRAGTAKAATRYDRVVYRYDVVPRVPFTAPVARFVHGGTCVYYDGWYDGKELAGDEPDPNYFDPRYVLSKYGNAVGDLAKGAFLWARAGRDYREGFVSLFFRCIGLVFPGLASHSLRDYVDAVRLGRVAPKQV